MNRGVFYPLLMIALSVTVCAYAQQPATLTIDTMKTVHAVSPTLYGLMTEEINHSYDGGLYAQLLRNPTFRHNWSGTEGWGLMLHGSAAATIEQDASTGPSTALGSSLKLTTTSASAGNEAGLSNSGYWGIAVEPHTVYRGSFYARAGGEGENAGAMTARLISDDDGAVLAQSTIALHKGAWSRYEFTLRLGAISQVSGRNHLLLTVAHPGTLWLQLATLFPPTFNNRPNGNRIDLMQKMAALHPHFLRLPGGNYLEGDTLADWYNWRKTIGPLVDRPGHQAPWSYWSTDGLGLLEFLEWCEDLKVEPVLAVYAGYALQHDVIKPGKYLEPFVQAALDEVEYATGDTTTRWGAERAKDGHPAPFQLTYIEIGNEDEFDKSGSYDGRFAQFALALRNKYPQYKLIATTPVKVPTKAQPDLVDDHYYKSPAQMFELVHHYDDASRAGGKIFVGEWATRSGTPTPNFGDALGDAAWMTGLERNSDLIVMASYAPLLVNVNPGAMQWSTDLIGFDAVRSYGSPSYYAQSLFAANLGDAVPSSTLEGAGARFFYSATVSWATKMLYLKLVNASTTPQPLSIDLRGSKPGTAKVHTLHAATFEATNSITTPGSIVPVESTITLTTGRIQPSVPPLTIEVLDIPLQ